MHRSWESVGVVGVATAAATMGLMTRVGNTPHVQMLASILEPFARGVKAPARFVATCFGEPLGGYPLGPMLASSGTPLVQFCQFVGGYR